MDEERGHIQMLLEAGPGDHARGGWAEKGVARGSGHKQPGNPKARSESPTCFSWTSQPRAGPPGGGGSGGVRLAELDEKPSKYEMELKPLLRVDAALQEPHPQKRRHSKGAAPCRGSGDDRAFGAQRLRAKAQNKENARPVAEPAVQRLESLRLGGRAEPRLLRWDLTFSPPQRSAPMALESDEETRDQLKPSSVSAWSCGKAGPLLRDPGETLGGATSLGGRLWGWRRKSPRLGEGSSPPQLCLPAGGPHADALEGGVPGLTRLTPRRAPPSSWSPW